MLRIFIIVLFYNVAFSVAIMLLRIGVNARESKAQDFVIYDKYVIISCPVVTCGTGLFCE